MFLYKVTDFDGKVHFFNSSKPDRREGDWWKNSVSGKETGCEEIEISFCEDWELLITAMDRLGQDTYNALINAVAETTFDLGVKHAQGPPPLDEDVQGHENDRLAGRQGCLSGGPQKV